MCVLYREAPCDRRAKAKINFPALSRCILAWRGTETYKDSPIHHRKAGTHMRILSANAVREARCL